MLSKVAWSFAATWSLAVIEGSRAMIALLSFVPSEREAYDRPRSARQQFAQCGVDEIGVFGVEHRVAGAVAPDRRDRPEFGARHARHLAAAVLDGEIEVGLARHDDRVGGDRAERLGEMAAVRLVAADVGVLPGPQHSREI